MSTIKVNIADATIADLQTKLGLNRSVAKVITEQKPCNMEKFLQIEGVDWDDIKSKEPNAELEFISANESMSTDNKPVLPDGSELPSENITGEFIKFTQQYWQTQQAEFNKFTQLMTKKLETCQSKIPVNKLDMNDSKSEIKEEMQHFQLAVESVNKKGIKVENINEINPQNSELGTSNGKDSYQSEHESVNGKNLQHSDSEVPSCKESVSSKPVHNDHKKDENDSQCKHAKTKTDHFAEYHQVYESKVVDGVYRPTNTTNSDPKSTGQGHSAHSSLMQNGINLAEEHNRNGVIVKDGVCFSLPALPNQASESIMGEFERFTQQFQSVMQGEFNKFAQQMSVRDGVVVTKPNPTLVAKNAQIKQQPTSYSREGIVETDFNVWNKKLAYLPKFDGTNWQAFISVLEHNISRHNLTNSLQLDLLESKLSGQAFQAYGQAHTSMDTYAELKKFLQLRFGTRITPQNCRDDLCHIKQCTDESLTEFTSRVKLIPYGRHPGKSQPHRSTVEVNTFLQGCRDHALAKRVIQNTQPSLDSALNDMEKMVQNAHIFKSSNLEKARVVHHINNSEDTETRNMTTVTSNDDEYPDQRGLAYNTDSRAQNVDSPQIGNVEVKTTISPSQCKSARVDVTVLGKSISGMIDSATQVTVIDHKCWLTITGSPPVGKEVKLTQVDVNRNMVAILVPDVEIQVGTYHIKMPIFVTDLHVSDKLLLGLDFLSSAGAILHLLRNTTTTGAVQTPINLTHNKNCVVQPTLLAGQVHTGGDAEKIDEPPIMFDHLWGDAEKIYKPPIMFDHLWGDAEKIDEPPIMFDHLWGDAEKIDEPPIMFDHLWGDAEKIDEPSIMFDHLWGDAEKIDKPPIMFDHLWRDAEKIPITLTDDKNQGVQLALSAKQVYTAPGGEANLSTVPNTYESHVFELPAHLTELSQANTIVIVKEESYFGTRKTSKSDFKIEWGTALGAIPNTIEGPQHIRSDLERSPESVTAVLKRTHLLNVTEVNTFSDCVNVHNNNGEKYAEVAAPLCALTGKKNSEAIVWEPKVWEQLSRPPDKCVGHQTGNDLGCNPYTRFSKLWEQLSRPPDRCDCYLVSNNLSKLPCGGCNYCIRMNKQWEQLTRPPDECNCYQVGNDLSKLPCGGCNYCTRMTKQWEQFSLDVDDVLPSTVLDPLKIINAEIRAVNVKEVKESTLHTPAPNWCSTLLVSDIRDKQREDPDLILAVNWVFNETVPTQAELAMSSTVARFYWSNRNLLSGKNEIIYYRWIEDTSSRDLIIVPRALKEVVLSGCHDEITAGHFSSRKTLSRIRQNYFWKNMSQDCSLYVHSCVNCSTQKKATLTARAPLINYQAGNPLDRVHIDILGPFPISRSGNRYVLMLIDQFTRWLEAYPLPDQTAEQVARVVVDQFIARFGSPLYIHSDQGRNFESDLFGSVCELLDIVKTRTTPTHPASNGQVERYNTILLALIRCHIDGASDKWDEAVPLLAGAIRSMQNRHTGMTANMLMLGREVRRPISLAYSFNELVPQSCPHEYVKELLKNFHEVHHLARDKLKTAMKIQKQAYDTKIREADFHVGDLVYRRNLLLKKGDSRKLAPPWVGPFLVVQQLSEVTYKVQGKRRSFVLHHNILRPCRDRSIPFWMRRLRHRFLKNLDQEDDPIMFDHLWDDVKKVSDPSPKYTEPSLRVPIDGIHTPEEFDSNVKSNPKNSEGSNSAIGVVVNEKINETTDLMANKQVNEAINLVPLQEPIISRSGRPRKLPRHLNDYNL